MSIITRLGKIKLSGSWKKMGTNLPYRNLAAENHGLYKNKVYSSIFPSWVQNSCEFNYELIFSSKFQFWFSEKPNVVAIVDCSDNSSLFYLLQYLQNNKGSLVHQMRNSKGQWFCLLSFKGLLQLMISIYKYMYCCTIRHLEKSPGIISFN